MNPITNELLFLLHESKDIECIEPEKSGTANKTVTFHFADGSKHQIKTDCDHNTFLDWWSDTGALIRRIKAVRDIL